MELLYLYIEDDGKNIKDCEFNFSPQYKFHYQKDTKYLDFKEREDYIPDFWNAGNISNITAIIGKNGSGKSNLIEYIIRFCSSSTGVKEFNKGVIFIYKKDNQLFINSNDISSNYRFNPAHYTHYPLYKHNVDSLTKIIYYSPHTEKFVLKELGKGLLVDDVSNSGILRSDSFRRGNRQYSFTDLEYLQMLDSLRHLWLFKYLSQHPNDFGLKIPNTLNIRLNASDSKKDFTDPNYQKLFNDLDKHHLTFEEHIQNRLLNQIFTNKEAEKQSKVTDFNEWIEEQRSNRFYKSLVNLFKQGKVIYNKGPYALGPYNFYFEFKIRTEDLDDDFIKGLYYYYFRSEVYFGISTLELYYNMNENVSWEWSGISSGELSFYNLFSRLLESIEIVQNTIYENAELKNILLLLDEPETSFHPEWQRKFLNEFIQYTKTAFNHFKVQIIIASHSPILVSDFPKENIIFLDKDEKNGNCKVVESIMQENTFGANIHSLYRNSFFLNGLPIGEFAKNRIEEIIVKLDNGEASKEILKQIHLIGEPLIKDQLLKKFNQNLPNNIEERIFKLETEIAELRKRKQDDQN